MRSHIFIAYWLEHCYYIVLLSEDILCTGTSVGFKHFGTTQSLGTIKSQTLLGTYSTM